MSLSDLALPVVKMLPPEAAHTATIEGLKLGIGLPKIDPIQWNTPVKLPNSGLQLFNPIGLAAGFDKNADVFRQMARFGFGLIECGTVTPQPQPGNAKPRLFRLTEDEAVINRMGFNNHGLGYFTRRLKRAKQCLIPIGANVGANKTSDDFIADYETGIRETYAGANYITINISSPNTPGLRSLQDKGALKTLLSRCEIAHAQAQSAYEELHDTDFDGWKPVFLKVAPDLDDKAIAGIIETVRREGHWLSGLIISNTTIERPDSLQSRHKSETGGLSGVPLMAKSTAVLKAFASELIGEFDLIGCGGVTCGADAYAKIRAGAHAVQLYSALSIHGPGLVERINMELAMCLKLDGFRSVEDAVGADLN